MNSNIIKAGMIAGGSLGFAGGFMTRGQQLEEQGVSDFKQVSGGIANGLLTGVAGVGVGAGATTTAMALRGLLKK